MCKQKCDFVHSHVKALKWILISKMGEMFRCFVALKLPSRGSQILIRFGRKGRTDGPASNSKQRGHYRTGKQIYIQNEKHFTFGRYTCALTAIWEAVHIRKINVNGAIRLEERWRIPEELSSNLGLDIRYSVIISGFPQSSQNSTSVRPCTGTGTAPYINLRRR
jgi:hypothetical protein